MRDRVITGSLIGVIYVAVILLSLTVFKYALDVFVVLIMTIASLEIYNALKNKFAKPILFFIILAIILSYTAFFLLHFFKGSVEQAVDYSDLASSAFIGVLLVMFLFTLIFVLLEKNYSMQNAMSTLFVFVYPIMLLLFMLEMNYLKRTEVRSSAIILLFLIPALTDITAFFVGSKVGGRKLAPKISPKKTVSGAIGGLFGGMLAGFLVYLMTISSLFNKLGLAKMSNFDLIHFILLGFFGAIFTIFGDLAASYIKRRCEIKDYGSILKGHGGIMDRIDGMMFAAFIINLYMIIFL